MADFVKEASRILRVIEARGVIPLATMVYNRGIIDRVFGSYPLSLIALHVVYEATRQNDIPITRFDYETRTKMKINMKVLARVRKEYKRLGYEPKHIVITHYAKTIVEKYFKEEPKEIVETFLKLAEDLVKSKCTSRTNPKVMLTALYIIANELHGIKVETRNAVFKIHRTKKSIHSFSRYTVEAMKTARKYLERVGYEWKQ